MTFLAGHFNPTGTWTKVTEQYWRRDLPDGRKLSVEESERHPGQWMGWITAPGTRVRVHTYFDPTESSLATVMAGVDALAGVIQPRTCHRCYAKEQQGVVVTGRDPIAICEKCISELAQDIENQKAGK